jgi:hypothetical protein
MIFEDYSCLSWTSLLAFVLFGLFKLFQKKLFAAFCSFMARGPRFVEQKKKLFARLNDQAEKASSYQLKVSFYFFVATSFY